MPLICELKVKGRIVRLIVNQRSDAWRWAVHFADDKEIIDSGAVESRLAAQVDAQLALERWVHRVTQGRTHDLNTAGPSLDRITR